MIVHDINNSDIIHLDSSEINPSTRNIDMEFKAISRWLIYLGSGLITTDVIVWLLGKLNMKVLPGTFKIHIGETTLLFPILLSVILSVVLTIILNLIIYLFHR
jgi:hypothetical protein